MKNILLFTLMFILTPAIKIFAQNGGQTTLFNNDWKFHLGDVEQGGSITFNDTGWRHLDLPHDWSIEGTYSREWASGTAFLPGGIGWYRKSFTITELNKNKKIYIYFDGVYKESEVWLNGHYLGKRPNGFIPFQYELTPFLNFGGKNVIAVRVDHSQFADSRWYTGSGIYRNVYLITKPKIHIAQWGVSFTTPQVSAVQALVNVSVAIVNGSYKNQNVTVKCRLVNAKNKIIASSAKNVNSNSADSSSTVLTFAVKNPALWSVEPRIVFACGILNSRWAAK